MSKYFKALCTGLQKSFPLNGKTCSLLSGPVYLKCSSPCAGIQQRNLRSRNTLSRILVQAKSLKKQNLKSCLNEVNRIHFLCQLEHQMAVRCHIRSHCVELTYIDLNIAIMLSDPQNFFFGRLSLCPPLGSLLNEMLRSNI